MPYAVAISSAGGNATITIPAVAGTGYTIAFLVYSYNGLLSLGAGNLTMSFSGVPVLDFDIKDELLGTLTLDSLPNGYIYNTNLGDSVTITLAGTGTLIGKLSVYYQVFT